MYRTPTYTVFGNYAGEAFILSLSKKDAYSPRCIRQQLKAKLNEHKPHETANENSRVTDSAYSTARWAFVSYSRMSKSYIYRSFAGTAVPGKP